MLSRINRIARSIFSLNRKIEFDTIVDMLNLNKKDNLLRFSSYLRSIFIKNPKLLLIFFPAFYFLCRIGDRLLIGRKHKPQILIVQAEKE